MVLLRKLNHDLPPEFSAEVRRHIVLHQEGRGPEASVTEHALELSSSPRVSDGCSARLCPLPLLATSRASALWRQTGRVKTDLTIWRDLGI